MAEQLELFPRESILDTANKIIYGDREQTYGHPAKNLECIGAMWSAYMKSRFDVEVELTADDVALMQVLLKVSRLGNTPGHRDSLIDICGYTALVERCHE